MATVGHVGIVMYTRVWTTCEEQHLLVLIVLQTDAAVCIRIMQVLIRTHRRL